MSVSVAIDRYLRLKKGPTRLPRNIVASHALLRLFVAYLSQPVTKDALEEAAATSQLGLLTDAETKVRKALAEITCSVGIPHSHEDLCRLVARAPQLETVVEWARRIGDETVLPAKAIPPYELIDWIIAVYHQWVTALSRTDLRQ